MGHVHISYSFDGLDLVVPDYQDGHIGEVDMTDFFHDCWPTVSTFFGREKITQIKGLNFPSADFPDIKTIRLAPFSISYKLHQSIHTYFKFSTLITL
jgi:hypothetical protein